MTSHGHSWSWPAKPSRRHCSATSWTATSPSSSALRRPNGRCHNRLALDRRWTDDAGVDDCWGRALWGLGTAAARAGEDTVRRRSAEAFALSARWRCRHRRAMTFAALGAAEVLAVAPDDSSRQGAARRRRPGDRTPDRQSRVAMARSAPDVRQRCPARSPHRGRRAPRRRSRPRRRPAAPRLAGRPRDKGWPLVSDPSRGLVARRAPSRFRSTADRGGSAGRRVRPRERLSGDVRWPQTVDRAVGWFLGDNDAGIALYEPSTGGGCDGLHADARNENQGAESTLAMIATLQHARALVQS